MSAPLTGYLAPEGFEAELAEELGEVRARHGRLMLAPGPPREVAWAQNTWLEPRRLTIRSIKDAARQLRAIQRNWALYSADHHRRAALVEGQLPHVSAKPIEPYAPLPTAPLGSWTLLDRDTVLASPRCSSPFPHGEVRFVEDKTGPPSRAYLKLWEAFTLTRRWPEPGARVLDLGSAPGGWSWVLAGLGARVSSVDKAPLDPSVAAMDGVEHRRTSAFALDPDEVGPVDWLFSDVICYPSRLLTLVRRWLEARPALRFVCTLKFQGATDHATARAFAAIEGSSLRHLSHNRHELTWLRL
ncbi:MAG TPA: SAM-dependent methyltransferase [Sandaracinaceae bacterium LLY-WYZ-13_1]|nr:SAM-dependent methyltransferase [Sandaracinaceae bacterium LLY-WYZ-13_1]